MLTWWKCRDSKKHRKKHLGIQLVSVSFMKQWPFMRGLQLGKVGCLAPHVRLRFSLGRQFSINDGPHFRLRHHYWIILLRWLAGKSIMKVLVWRFSFETAWKEISSMESETLEGEMIHVGRCFFGFWLDSCFLQKDSQCQMATVSTQLGDPGLRKPWISKSAISANWHQWYCWWKKSCTTWDV